MITGGGLFWGYVILSIPLSRNFKKEVLKARNCFHILEVSKVIPETLREDKERTT